MVPPDTGRPGVLDKAQEDPLGETHALLPHPCTAFVCLNSCGILALFPWEQEPENLISPGELPSFSGGRAFCPFVCGGSLSISLTFLLWRDFDENLPWS